MSNTEPLSNLDILLALQQSILCQNSPSEHISEQDSPGDRRNWVCINVVLASFDHYLIHLPAVFPIKRIGKLVFVLKLPVQVEVFCVSDNMGFDVY